MEEDYTDDVSKDNDFNLKVKLLKNELKDTPPFLIRRVLTRGDVNGDVSIAREHLKEMQSNYKEQINSSQDPSPKEANQFIRGYRGRHRRGRQGRQQRDTRNQNIIDNSVNQSQPSIDNQDSVNQSQGGNTNFDQSKANSIDNQSQSRRSRNWRNRYQNRNQNLSFQQFPSQFRQQGRGNDRGGRGRSNFMPRIPQQQYNLLSQSVPYQQQEGFFHHHNMAPHDSNYPQNGEIIDGFQRSNIQQQQQRRQKPVNQIVARQQPLEPNVIVLRGLSIQVPFDNVRNFIEARTQEQVMDIAFSDDESNALITLEELSDFEKAKQRVSERKLEGCTVSIERVPVSSSILVKGLAPKTTRDGLDYYFSAKAHVDVTKVVLKDNYAVVTFADPRAIQAILQSRHTLDDSSLNVCKYYPFMHDISTQSQTTSDVAIAVNPNTMAFISSNSHSKQLSDSLKRLGFKLNHKPGENIAYLASEGSDVSNKEKGIQCVTKFIGNFTTFDVDLPSNSHEAVLAALYEHQENLGKEQVLMFETPNQVKIVCLVNDSQKLKANFQEVVGEVQTLELRKSIHTKEIEVKDGKIVVLKKFKIIDRHLLSDSGASDLKVSIDEEKEIIRIEGNKQKVSESTIKLYKILAKISEREVLLSKTLLEMFGSDQGMADIAEKLMEHNIDAVFCVDAEKEIKTSVLGLTPKDAEDAAGLINRLVSELKLKVENENKTVLSSKDWEKLCDDLKKKYRVHIRRNEYQDTWIAGFNDDVIAVNNEMKAFLDQNCIATESFSCHDDGVRTYLLKNKKADLQEIETTLKKYSVVIKPSEEESNELLVTGSKTGLKRAQKSLDILANAIATKKVVIQQPGLDKFFKKGAGMSLINSIESENRCTIRFLKAAPTGSSIDSDIETISLEDGWSTVESSEESESEDMYAAAASPIQPVVSSMGQSMKCGNVAISWKTGNIVNENADILVGSVLGQLAKAFQVQGMDSSVIPGNVRAIPPPQNLSRCSHLILTHCAKWKTSNADQILRTTVQQCLQEALRLNAQSIAFPVLGTAGLGVPKNDASRLMISEVINIVSGWSGMTCVKDIRFVVFDKDQQLVSAFQQEFSAHMRASGSQSSQSTHSVMKRVFDLILPLRPKNLSTDIVEGDLLQEKSDAIVNIINRDLTLASAGKVSKVLNATYPALQASLSALGPQSEGSVVVTNSGRNVLHVVCQNIEGQNVQAAIERCIQKADERRFMSISLPAFGTGNSNMGAIESAEATFSAINNTQHQLTHVRSIRVVIYNDPNMFATFQHVARQKGLLKGQRQFPVRKSSVRKSSVKGKPSPKRHVKDQSASQAISFTIYGRSSDNVDEAEVDLKKRCADSCKTQEVQSDVVPKLSERQRTALAKKARKLDVAIEFDNDRESIVVRGDSNDVTVIVNDIWKEINERNTKDKDSEQAKVTYKSVRWQYELNGQTAFFTKDVNAVIEKAFVNKDKNVTVKILGEKSVIDLINNDGREVSTGRSFTVARTTVGTANGDFSLPKEWSPMPFKHGKEAVVHLFPVHSTEYQRVCSLFQRTGGRGTIQKIERIQNPHLYEQYQAMKRKLDKENPGYANEKELFHGTAEKNLDAINKDGFNRSFCGQHGTAYGNGVYFARDSSYSLGYSPANINQQKHMYVALVLTGRVTGGHSGLIVAPSGYNSVSGHGNSIFVVFHDAQCYPEYLITFT